MFLVGGKANPVQYSSVELHGPRGRMSCVGLVGSRSGKIQGGGPRRESQDSGKEMEEAFAGGKR